MAKQYDTIGHGFADVGVEAGLLLTLDGQMYRLTGDLIRHEAFNQPDSLAFS